MPYIGRDLNRGNYLKLDDISSSFNSSTTTFNLTVGGSAFIPGSAFSILVSVGGVIQEPESSYQVNNSEITFANAPTAQDSFFCIALAVPIGIGVPGNGTVNGTQLAKPFNYDGFFYLNDGTNRVGINSSSPTVALDVIGNIKLNGNLVTGGGSGGINAGVVTCTGLDLNGNGDVSGNFVIGGDLTVNGTTSTIDTNLIGVDRVEIGANSNTVAGIAVTQSGSADLVRLYDGSTQVVTIDDEGKVGLGSAIPSEKLDVIGNIKAGGDILIPTNVDSTDAGGVAVQRFWTTGNISAGNIYKCGSWFETEGSVQLLISVRAIGASHSGGSVYLWQGGYNQIGGSGISRLAPLTSGNGHGNGADTGVDSNSWGVLIHQVNVRTYAVWVYNNTGTATKNLQISVTELNRGNDFTDISSTVALSSVSVNAGKLNSIKTTAIQELHINGSNGIIHDGDPDTKIKFPTTNAFSIETAGDERFRITSAGDVGIGSIIPSAKLDVAGIVKATDFKAPDGNTNGLYVGNSDDLHLFHNGADSYVENDTGNLTLTNKNNNSIIFKTTSSETEVVRIKHTGNVGIGTDDPTGKLEINSASSTEMITLNVSNANFAKIGHNSSSGVAVLDIRSEGHTRFLTNGNNERLRINSNGSLQVTPEGSTSNPYMLIDTSGDSVRFNAQKASGNNEFRFLTQSSGTVAEAVRINSSGNIKLPDNGEIQFGGALNTGDGDLRIYHTTSGTSWIRHTNSSEYFILEGNQIDFRDYATGNYRARMGTEVKLYYDGNNEKFRTTDTGIDVTGEVAATQDYPDLKPTLDLNFAGTAKLDTRVTFTREGTGTYYGKDGLVKFASTNEPRFDHDPVTRECRGLLIEEQRRNQFRYTTTPGDSGWDNSKSGTFVQNTTETAAPDGTFTATKWTFTNTDPYLYDVQNLDANDPYTISMWVKAGTNMAGDRVQMRIGGTPYSSGDIEVIPADGTWRRISYTRTIGGSAENSASVGFEPQTSPSGNPASGDVIYIWGLQFEKGEFVSSYIPSHSNYEAIRGADKCYIDGQDFDDFYNQPEGTIVSSHSLLENVSATSNCYTYQVAPDTGTSEAPFRLIDRNSAYGNSLGATSINSNSNVCFFRASGNPVTPANKKMKVAFAIKKDDFAASFNGGATSTDTSGALSETSDHLSIGYYKPSPQAYLNGHIQRLAYYPKRLPNNQLRTLSS